MRRKRNLKRLAAVILSLTLLATDSTFVRASQTGLTEEYVAEKTGEFDEDTIVNDGNEDIPPIGGGENGGQDQIEEGDSSQEQPGGESDDQDRTDTDEESGSQEQPGDLPQGSDPAEPSESEPEESEEEDGQISGSEAEDPENGGAVDAEPGEDPETSQEENESGGMDDDASIETEPLPAREPERFYEEAVPEDYGTLTAYDAYSRTYHVEGNQYVTVIGNDGATYIDEEGILRPVDNRLVENPASTFTSLGGAVSSYVNGANDYTVLFPESLSVKNGGTQTEGGEDCGITILQGDYLLTLYPAEGTFASGIVKDNAIRYSNVFPGVDYQYTVLGNSVKEDIILLEKGEKESFSYYLEAPGLEAALYNNTLYLYQPGTDPETEALFVLEAPEMEDAAGQISFGVRMEMEGSGDGYLVTVTPDRTWLDDPERAYPVRIDPTAIQVTGSAIRMACAEEGSPNTAIGDNQYPYVGYDDGITSGNYAGFGSRHLNCRTYFAVNYDFSKLAEEAEIVSATFQIYQKTLWSRGTSEFGLYGVEEDWRVNGLTWNNQLDYNHYFLDVQNASASRGEAVSFDVTEEVSAWINGTAENHGFVMKAQVEAPNAEAAAAGVMMQCEVFYNNSAARYAPKLILSWTGDLIDLDSLTLDDTTIEVYPVVERGGDKSTSTLAVAAHGLAKPGSTVHYVLINGATGETEAETSLVYPDTGSFAGAFPGALAYKRRLSNWQSEAFSGLVPGQVYYIEAYAEDAEGTGAPVTSDPFLIHREGALDLIPRIALHYGVETGTILADMRMQDALTREGNLIFIRCPQNTAAYPGGELSLYYKAMADGLLLGRAQNCEFGFEPVNLNTGNFYMEQTDGENADIGGSFAVTRSYNSLGAGYSGSFGYGWSTPLDERLGELSDGSLLWLRDTGNIVTFVKTENGYAAPAGADYTLEETEGGYAIKDNNTLETAFFNVWGLLEAREDIFGNRTIYAYDTDLRLQAVITPSGKRYAISLDGEGRITALTLPDGGTVSYTYDEAGNLACVTDPAGDSVRYEYDAAHRMTGWYDENGHLVVENGYDAEGRVTRQRDAEGAEVTLSYERTGEGHAGTTRATDANGNMTLYHYDSQGRTTSIEYPDGTGESRAYDGEGHLSALTDRQGVTTAYTYDAGGRILTETRQDGAQRRYSYTEAGLPETVTDYDGAVTRYTYDEKNRPVSVTDAEGGVTSYAYDASNRVISITDPEGNAAFFAYEGSSAVPAAMTDAGGNTWTYTYDAMNRQLSATDPEGHTVRSAYNAKGWKVKETDAAGNSTVYTFDKAGAVTAVTDREGGRSSFVYDKMNRMLSGKDPLGNTLAYTWDANGNRLTETDAEGNTTSYTYDAMNRPVSVTDGNGSTTSCTYDGADRILTVTDRTGAVTTYTYDPATGAVLAVTDARGNVTSYETDACGRTTRILYPDGSSVSYTYDRLGRILSVTDQLGTVTALAYDGNGNLVSLREGTRTYTYEYDARNLLVKTTDPEGGTCTYTYDGAGNLASASDELGGATDYAYDVLNRLVSVTDPLGGALSYTYDKEDRLLSMTSPEGRRTAWEYDAIGQLTAQTDPAGNRTAYTYDGISRLLSAADAEGNLAVRSYDAEGRVLEEADALGSTHAYAYDGEGRVLTHTYPNGEKESYTYLPTGEVETYTDRYGVVTTYTYDQLGRIIKASDTAGNEMSYEYDAAGNLVKQTDVLGRSALYAYDAYGRPVSVTDVDGAVTAYAYDACNRLVQVTDPAGNVTTYEYDAAGNLLALTKPGEALWSYSYDALHRLTGKMDPEGAATAFVYDKDGNLTGHTDGNGVETAYGYDALNRLISYTDGNGGMTSYAYDLRSRLTAITTPEGLTESYGYDAVGNLLSVTNGEGETWRYTYDKLYRLVRQTSPLGAEETYTYDKHDIVTSVTDALGAVTLYQVNANGLVEKQTGANGGSYLYAYDEVHRLTSVTTPLGYRTAFTYGAGSDILEERDSLGRVTKYEYDILHNLVRVTDPEGGVTSYEYDARSNRTAATNGLGNTFTFSYDKVDRMTTVTDPEEKAASILYDAEGHVKSVTASGERTTGYAYDNNYNLLSVTDPKGYVYHYAYDKDGRLTGTTDPLGQTTGYTYDGANRILTQTDKMDLTETYTYDAHGNVLFHTATDGRVTGYTYDLLDRITSLTDPMGSTAYYTWDVMGNLTGVTDYLGRGTAYTYDLENNLTSVTDAAGRKESMEYDAASRLASYTSNGGNTVSYDYNKLNALVEKSYADAEGKESADPVEYGYDALGERTFMEDSTGDTLYTYDALGRLTSVTTYRTPETGNGADDSAGNGAGSTSTGYSHGEGRGDTVGYTYDGADNLSAVIYPDGTKVIYEYDLNDNLIKVTGRKGEITTYEYDALNRPVAVHLPDGISTYKTYNARNQVTEQTTMCNDCGWILGHYLYTYDDRGYLIAEATEEARERDPYGRQPHNPYKPEKQGEKCDHGRNKTLSYYLLEMERSYTYDDAGKLLYATETQKGCGTTSWRYAYDLMGNRILEEKKNPGGKVEESNRYVYNESNQLTEAVLCNGRTTRKVCYTYDDDGNLIKKYSPTDNGLTTYQYTVEDRLEAVYTGNAYNRTLQMAAAYDGDGNRVYQVNYNPEKDEDFSCYYDSYNNCDYNGTGIQLRVTGEVSPTEEELIELIAPAGATLTSKYELIEYINDVNREYVEVLVEQNINGRTDTTYTYGVDRISRELFNQTSRTAYYLYDPRGSVAGLADGEGHLTKTYRYSVTGELTYGSAAYENEYTYNGESYNPNIHSQYLRARYYDVVTANFLTEDSYLGNINEPLTLNRYNYCISSYLNYVDPSGFDPEDNILGIEAHKALQRWLKRYYPGNIDTEVKVYGYPYSETGKGKVDVILYQESGVLEVYEIKPATHTGHYRKEASEIPWIYTRGNSNYVPGWKQREGYIKVLEDNGEVVDEMGNTLGEYINREKPLLKLKSILDGEYFARYFSIPDHPGMIYYQIFKKVGDKMVPLKKRATKAKDNSKFDFCEITPIPRREEKPVAAIQRLMDLSIMTSILYKIIDSRARALQNMLFLPANSDFLINPYDRGPMVN